MSEAIDISTAQRKTLLALLRQFIPGVEVWAYGSRAKWTARPNSDLDLVAFTSPEQNEKISALKEALAESDLPFLVDLHVWSEVPERFHEIIRKEYVVIQEESRNPLPDGWRTLPLEECMAAIIDYRGKTPTKTTFGVPLVTAKIVKGGRIEPAEEFIAESDYEPWMRRGMPEKGDVVMTTEAPLGEVARLDGRKVALAQRVITLRGKPGLLDNGYLRYLLQSTPVQDELKARATGTTVLGIKQSELRKVRLTLPSLPEQKSIGHILAKLDDKIEVNRQMNSTLEGMARALFQSWFMDFDPVRRNIVGRNSRPEDSLFPDSFEDSLIGEIPKGWKSAKVSEICKNIFSGGTPRTSEVTYWDGEFPWLSSGETRNSFIIETEKTITQLGIDKSSTRLARKGCVVIASAGQGHTRGQTSLLAFDSYINQSVVALAANNAVASDLFLYFDLSRRYEEFRQLSDSHSSRGSLTTKLLGGVQVVLPAKDAIQKFDSIVSPLVAKIIANLQQSRALAILRDTLLPALLSGRTGVAPDLT